MLGMGKTALAKMVYNGHKVQSQYKVRAFIYLPTDFDTKQVLIKIMNSLIVIDDRVINEMSLSGLIEHVRQQLEGKRYLVVLDSVRTKTDWSMIRDAFPDNVDKRCRVLTTSVDRVTEDGSDYKLDFLSTKSSLELLRWKVFGNQNYCPSDLQNYERDIVNKCKGVPQGLVCAANMIRKRRDQVEWWRTVERTLHDDFTSSSGYITKLTYVQLPNHLKPCFLYLAAFHRDSEIPVWKLVRLWISEGFILEEEDGSRNLEDIAEQYLEQLVDQSFVMVSKRKSNGRIGTCKLTGMFISFCEMEAEKQNFFIKHLHLHEPRRVAMPRRIAINAIILDVLSEDLTRGSGIRSLLKFSPSEGEMEQKTLSCIQNSSNLVKVLDAGSLFATCLPAQLWSLVLLKYLAISGTIITLPSTFSHLLSLQTLIVDTTSPTLEIEADIWQMLHFRHLHTNASATFPCKSQKTEEGGSDFRTMCYISPKCCKKEVFHQTKKLKKLGISGTLAELFEANGESSLLDYLHELEYLENMKLLNCNKFPGLPPKISLPKQLTKLTLSNTRLDWKEMRSLGEMEKLEILKLKEYAFIGEQWKTANGGFLRLKHLHIGHMNLMVWQASADHFPQLRRLEISECDQLRRIPHELADISSLQSVHLHRSTSHGVTYSLKRIRLVKFLQEKQADKKRVFDISVFPPHE